MVMAEPHFRLPGFWSASGSELRSAARVTPVISALLHFYRQGESIDMKQKRISDFLACSFRDITEANRQNHIWPDELTLGNYTDSDYDHAPAFFCLRMAIREQAIWADLGEWSSSNVLYDLGVYLSEPQLPHPHSNSSSTAGFDYCLLLPRKGALRLGAAYYPTWGDYDSDHQEESPNEDNDSGEVRVLQRNPPRAPEASTTLGGWFLPCNASHSALHSFGKYAQFLVPSLMPGLPLYKKSLKGIGVVVRTQTEADWICHDLLMMVDRDSFTRNEPDVDQFAFVLPLDQIPSNVDMNDPVAFTSLVSKHRVNLPALAYVNDEIATEMIAAFNALVQTVQDRHPPRATGTRGGTSWLWLLDNHHPLTRALMKTYPMRMPEAGFYLFCNIFTGVRDLEQKEEMITELAALVKETFKIEASYFTSADFVDIDGPDVYFDVDLRSTRMCFNFTTGSVAGDDYEDEDDFE
jgi:hypothetical protein